MAARWLSWTTLLLLVAVLCLADLPGGPDGLAADRPAHVEQRVALAIALAAGGGAALLVGTPGAGDDAS